MKHFGLGGHYLYNYSLLKGAFRDKVHRNLQGQDARAKRIITAAIYEMNDARLTRGSVLSLIITAIITVASAQTSVNPEN
jgi:hypothetical protein